MWTQIVGKVRMELSPFVNHWWHVTLYVTPRYQVKAPSRVSIYRQMQTVCSPLLIIVCAATTM